MTIEVDDNVREDYWCFIRNMPEAKGNSSFHSPGKYSRRKPYLELSVGGKTKLGGNRGGSKAI